MFNVLFVYGIPSQIIEGIKGLFLETMAQVFTKDGNTIYFQSLLEFNRVTHWQHTYSSLS